jgi:hypothetical protein
LIATAQYRIDVLAAAAGQPERRSGEAALARLIADVPLPYHNCVITALAQLLDNSRRYALSKLTRSITA